LVGPLMKGDMPLLCRFRHRTLLGTGSAAILRPFCTFPSL
jgi:hypothetical protein